MALAWKAGWVQALRGSNPLSSATEFSYQAEGNQFDVQLNFCEFAGFRPKEVS